ncbi:MAG: CPBP family intramembrane metalloprotease [Bacteroidetes bacterium]|nr:CPBP family intramembrane metalloprotease [Bacteroidota bacterium]
MTKLILATCIGIAATLLLYLASHVIPQTGIQLHANPFINKIIQYQAFALVLAFVVMFVTLKAAPQSVQLLRIGQTGVAAGKMTLLGISGKKSWTQEFFSLLFVISAATFGFMFFTRAQAGTFKPEMIFWIVLFSLTNSFGEEIIYRFGINGMLTGYTPASTVFLISGLVFGAAHWGGNPGGPVGVLMAGLLGYVASKATAETSGLGIAWALHFVQDVIIYTFLFRANG